MNKARCVSLIILLALLGCDQHLSGSATSNRIFQQFEATGNKSVNLAQSVPGQWEKICILGPYSGNETAKATLGFDWNAESKTSINTNEGITLLLFVQGSEVIEYVEYARAQGDFSNLTGKCFARNKAKFIQFQTPQKGWPGLFPENDT